MPRRHRADLFGFALRSHRVAAAAWALGLGGIMWVFGVGYALEIADFPGGGAGFAQAAEATAEAMRVARWPAERLDTIGGYVTYHNLTLFPLLLAVYAIVQGTQAIRGVEDRAVLETWLATGRTRTSILRDRALAFGAVLVAIALGLGAGTALGMDAAGETATRESFIQAALVVGVAAAFYSLALLVSQLVASARTAAGIAALAMLALFVVNNLQGTLGPLEPIRWLSPFAYRQMSDVLIPGHTFDPWATFVLGALALAPVPLAAMAFQRRDLGAALWHRRAVPQAARAFRAALGTRSLWTLGLAEQRVGLAVWGAAAGAFLGMYAALGRPAIDVWEQATFLRALLARRSDASLEDQYLSFAVTILAPIAAAFAVAQAARWAGEAPEGRVEMVLSCPVRRWRLVLERLASLTVGALVLDAAGLAGFVVGARLADIPVRLDGLARTAWDVELLALAVGGVGALALQALPRAVAGALGALVGLSYLVTLLAPLFSWPEWALRLSIFDAFGEPYLELPRASGIVLLATLALGGAALTALASERRRSMPA